MGSATCDTRAIFSPRLFRTKAFFPGAPFSSLPWVLPLPSSPPKETKPPASARGPCENENGGGKEGLITGRWLLTSPGSL